MNGRERLLTLLDGGTPDCLGLMPITMMVAADHSGVDRRWEGHQQKWKVAGPRSSPSFLWYLLRIYPVPGSSFFRRPGSISPLGANASEPMYRNKLWSS